MTKDQMRNRTRFLFRLLIGLGVVAMGLTTFTPQSKGASYPTKSIQVIIPWSAGGSTDLVGRVMATHLSEKWKLPVVTVNKTGGLGIPGTLEALSSRPDGYTVLVETNASSSLLEAWAKSVPFDIKERTYLAQVTELPHIFFVPAASPWKTLDDVANTVKRDPAGIKWGWMGGTGGVDVPVAQFMAALIAKGLDPDNIKKIKWITFPGGAPIATGLAGGHLDIGVTSAASAGALVSAGKIRPIAAGGPRRDILLPNCPSAIEAGWPTVSRIYWVGFSGPKNLPSQVVKRWVDTIREIIQDPKVEAEFKKLGILTQFRGGDEFRKFVLDEAKEIKSLPVGGVQ